MGAVYLVREGGARYALKVMHETLISDVKWAERFAQEAAVARTIASAHVVAVHGAGVDRETGSHWILMDFVPGVDLAAYLEAHEPLPRGHAEAILDQLLDAVAAAHAVGVVHRDLNPENILVAAGDAGKPPSIRLLDFGVAKVLGVEASSRPTAPGLGTPLWTAPEQGEERQKIRPNADVWALGLLAFRLLAGRSYWRSVNDPKASAFDVAMELRRAPLDPPSVRVPQVGGRALPAGFDAWFARCVVRSPEARFADAAEARAGLQAISRPAWRRAAVITAAVVVAGLVAAALLART